MTVTEILSTLREAVLCYEAHSSEHDGQRAIDAFELVRQNFPILTGAVDSAQLGDTEHRYEHGRGCVQHAEDCLDEEEKSTLSLEQIEELLVEAVCCRKYREDDESEWLQYVNAHAIHNAFWKGVHDEIENALQRIKDYYWPLPCKDCGEL